MHDIVHIVVQFEGVPLMSGLTSWFLAGGFAQ